MNQLAWFRFRLFWSLLPTTHRVLYVLVALGALLVFAGVYFTIAAGRLVNATPTGEFDVSDIRVIDKPNQLPDHFWLETQINTLVFSADRQRRLSEVGIEFRQSPHSRLSANVLELSLTATGSYPDLRSLLKELQSQVFGGAIKEATFVRYTDSNRVGLTARVTFIVSSDGDYAS